MRRYEKHELYDEPIRREITITEAIVFSDGSVLDSIVEYRPVECG
jgi:hypothetical protein